MAHPLRALHPKLPAKHLEPVGSKFHLWGRKLLFVESHHSGDYLATAPGSGRDYQLPWFSQGDRRGIELGGEANGCLLEVEGPGRDRSLKRGAGSSVSDEARYCVSKGHQ